ncbi:hypothetical protein QUB19_26280 [Microcoleus sp. B4-C5]|uniref:hypothetical protein n=1 Tax=unclassified Microcoleus TaxID=2642155 RepID=UPI002FCED382
MSGTRIIIRFQGKYAEILLKASQQRTVLILDQRPQIGYEGRGKKEEGRGNKEVRQRIL